MPDNPDLHHRRSIRLRGHDYSEAGAYFVTICTEGRVCLFGEITGGVMHLNDVGYMLTRWWDELPHKFTRAIATTTYIIMPNHMHGIIRVKAIPVGVDLRVYPDALATESQGADTQVRPYELGQIVQWFKTMTTNEYLRGVKERRWPSVNKRLWQRNYYEHIIRNEEDMNRIREYIIENPVRWDRDTDNPARITDAL
jgi:REP element-mobilizing transposase RayT